MHYSSINRSTFLQHLSHDNCVGQSVKNACNLIGWHSYTRWLQENQKSVSVGTWLTLFIPIPSGLGMRLLCKTTHSWGSQIGSFWSWWRVLAERWRVRWWHSWLPSSPDQRHPYSWQWLPEDLASLCWTSGRSGQIYVMWPSTNQIKSHCDQWPWSLVQCFVAKLSLLCNLQYTTSRPQLTAVSNFPKFIYEWWMLEEWSFGK